MKEGEFIRLIGPSGCGKSTQPRTAAGFECWLSDGTTIGSRAGRWTAQDSDRGMVFQDYGLFPWLTVRGNIGFGPSARGLLEQAQITETVDPVRSNWSAWRALADAPSRTSSPAA